MMDNKALFLFYLLVLTLFSAFPAKSIEDTGFLQDPEHLFWHDTTDLPTIRLHFEEDQWALLLTSSRGDREEVSGTFTYVKAGVEHRLENIGVKLSGNTSFVIPETASDPFVQANYTLDFDEFVDDQVLSGVSAMKLKRFKDDSTFVHEPLSNQIMHNFGIWTVHSSNYVRVEIQVGTRDNNYVGMYRLNESVNRHEYLDKRFGTENDGGFLWQGNYKDFGPAMFSRITPTWAGVGDFDEASFEYKGKGSKFDEGKAQLVEMAQNFTTLEGADFEDYVERHINMPILLKSLAAEAVLGHWDGFWGNANNYMFYIDENAVLHFIPFDTDNTLGTSLITADAGEQDPFDFGQSRNTPPLVTKILAIDRYKEQYAGYLFDLVNQADLMVEPYSVSWIQEAHNLIEDHLTNVTGDNEQIIDQPAIWANQPSYRLFELDSGKNWYATRRAAVLNALGAPTANAGPNATVQVGQSIQLDGSGSNDLDGTIVSYEWSNGLSGATPSVTFSEAQTVTLTLTVTDDNGFTSSDEVVITVTAQVDNVIEISSTSSGGAVGTLWLAATAVLFVFIRRPKSMREPEKRKYFT